MTRSQKITLVVTFLLTVIVCFSLYIFSITRPIPPKEYSAYKTVELKIADVPLTAYVVESSQDIERGLSGKKSLDEDAGMLFVFQTPSIYSFWMKEMLFPLDMIWIGADGRIVDVSENQNPDSYPNLIRPKSPALYVLEVNSGFFIRHNLKIGDETHLKNEAGTFIPL